MRDVAQIPLYFLPGTQCDEQLWQQVFELLPKHFIPHDITLPHGNTPLEIVHALHQQFAHQQTKPINLIGFSLGGYLAALYASCYPDNLQKLLILANAPHSLPEHEIRLREQTLSYITTHGYKGMPRKRIEQLLANANKHNADIIDKISAMDKRGGQAMLTQQLTSTSQRINLVPQLSTLPFDIKFVVGEEDNLVNIDTLKQDLALGGSDSQSKNVALDIIEHCGHMSPLESPQAVAQHIIDFFSETNC